VSTTATFEVSWVVGVQRFDCAVHSLFGTMGVRREGPPSLAGQNRMFSTFLKKKLFSEDKFKNDSSFVLGLGEKLYSWNAVNFEEKKRFLSTLVKILF